MSYYDPRDRNEVREVKESKSRSIAREYSRERLDPMMRNELLHVKDYQAWNDSMGNFFQRGERAINRDTFLANDQLHFANTLNWQHSVGNYYGSQDSIWAEAILERSTAAVLSCWAPLLVSSEA